MKKKKVAPVKRQPYTDGNATILKASDLGISLERSHAKYPWGTMQVGDAFEVKSSGSVQNAGNAFAKRHGLKLKFAKRSKGGKTYVVRIS